MTARSVRLLAALVAVLGAVVTVTGVVLVVRAVSAWRDSERIQRGPRVLAVVEATGRANGHHQQVTLRYTDGAGVHHQLEARFPLGLAKSTVVGTATSVSYDARAPGLAELAAHPRHSWQDAAIAGALTAVATGLWLHWVVALLLAARRAEQEPSIRLGPPGTVERGPPFPAPPSRRHAYGTLAVVSALLLIGGRLTAQLLTIDRAQEVAFPPLPVLPEHHGPVSLPAVLEAAPPATGPLVTPRAAAAIVAAAWQYRDHALAQDDLAEVRAIDAEPALAVDVANMRQGYAPNRAHPTPGDLYDLTAYTPRQSHWPLRLLGEAVTTVDDASALEVMVLTRSGPHASWRVALDTNVIGNARYTPAVDEPALDPDGYDLVPRLEWLRADAVVPDLARYWQSYRDTGAPPAGGVTFSSGYWTTDYAEQIAGTQDKTDQRNGIRAHVDYNDRPTPGAEVWAFGMRNNWSLVCSPMHETKTWAGGNQDGHRQKWGYDLPPGNYRTITTEFVRDPCVLVPPVPGGLIVFGADAWAVATTGTH